MHGDKDSRVGLGVGFGMESWIQLKGYLDTSIGIIDQNI